jgi:type IV pilus assembly protein PilO
MTYNDLKSLDFNNTGGWPFPVKIGTCVLIIAVILTIGYFAMIKGKLEERDGLTLQVNGLVDTFATKQAKASNLEAYKAQLAEMEDILRNLLRQLPSKTEMADLLVDISQTALSTGLETQLFRPDAEVMKTFYAEKPIALKMLGTYHQFGEFVSGVASLPRVVILTMHDISLKPAANDKSGRLVLEGTARTYRYVEDEEVPAGAAAAPAASAP